MKTIKKTALSAVAATLLSGLAVQSAFAADAPEVSPISANVTIVNDYRYRGISQSNLLPAIQGGVDYAHESGLYIGNWNSSISWVSDQKTTTTAPVSAPIEMDFYAGFKKDLIAEGFATDFGVLQYYYPMSGGAAVTTSPNTTELYAEQNFTFGPLTGFAKFSQTTTNLFGIADSSGSQYSDLTANYDTGLMGIVLNAHYGYQYVAGASSNNASYSDWKIGLTKDFGGGLSGSVAYVDSSAKFAQYGYSNKNMGKSTGLVSLTKAF